MLKMKKFKEQFFILLVLSIRNSVCVIDTIYKTATEVWKLYSMMDNMSLDNSHDFTVIRELSTSSSDLEIMNQANKIHKQLEQMEISKHPKLIINSLKLLPSEMILRDSLESIEQATENIDLLYRKLFSFLNKKNSDKWDELVKHILPHAEIAMQWMRRVVTETNKTLLNYPNIIDAIADHSIHLKSQLCGGSQLISNILVQLFEMIMIGEMKANIVLAFVNLCQYSAHEGWKILNDFAVDEFGKYFASYVNLLTLNIDSTDSLYLRACDPINGNWIRNEHFYELEGTFQTAIFRYHWSRCKLASCNAVWFNDLDRCKPEIYDQRSACYGTATNCIYLSAIEACALKSGPYKFQYLNSTKLGAMGKNFRCPKDNGYIIEDGIGLASSYAACACECHGNHNKISLSIMQSRVTSNKVITGLRFFRKNQILYIQPREGTLQANGYIPRNSQKWIPIPNHQKASEIYSIDNNNKVFFLDDLRLPSSHVLIGIKFNKVMRKNVKGLAIEIFGVPFEYNTGRLILKRELLISMQASNTDPGEGLSFRAESSIDAAILHTPSPSNIKYVSLRQSESSVDFGQSTLPFFDAVPIITDPPSVLGGFGIFHKGAVDYAGFIGLRLFSSGYQTNLLDFQLNYVVNNTVIFNHSHYH